MTLFLDSDDIKALATHELCERAALAAVEAESSGNSQLPPRIDVPSGHGFLRVMPAVLGPVMGVKVMTLTEGIGNRYLVLLYESATGELLGAFDADELTRLRTAAFTATAAKLMVTRPPRTLAVIGSGYEADGHTKALTRTWDFEAICVFSPSPERRVDFATRMTAELDVKVTPCDSSQAALADADLVMLATKSRTPVLDGAHLATGATVLSVGSTRPNLRELDAATMRRTGTLVVDDLRQVLAESGDILAALADGDLTRDHLAPVASVSADASLLRRSAERDLLTYKSVGTALQDLALARLLLDGAQRDGRGRQLGELAALKPFANNAVRVS
ncbi:ornithine cyclodeaminase family protein [Rugosimonospora acidiphila]|uniref:Ornithine cyclodeaminase family protein n=1 Tax=Rugosimonospora acidiphila TaxID=556531 RepID=A0ABP9S3E7_9ACTN